MVVHLTLPGKGLAAVAAAVLAPSLPGVPSQVGGERG